MKKLDLFQMLVEIWQQAVKRLILIGAEKCMARDYGPNKSNLDHI